MTGPTAITLLLLAPAAPVPAGPPTPPAAGPTAVDPAKGAEFGNLVYAAAMQVSTARHDTELAELAAGAVRGLYEAAGQTFPPEELKAVRTAKRHEDRITLIGDARLKLAAAPQLRGVRAYLAAAHGFRHALDPLSGLATMRSGSFVSVEMDFGLGFELDGVQGERVSAYRLERQIATGQVPPTGILGPPPRPDAIESPASLPWRVRKVVPGSPAHRAGLKPGDVLTHLNDAAVTADNADRLFGKLSDPPDAGSDPKTGLVRPAKFVFKVRRGTVPLKVELETDTYLPSTVAGCVLRDDGAWDGMLDPHHRIGYVRVGAVESYSEVPPEVGSHTEAAAILTDLAGRGCRGLILDLRWCPGGYVRPGVKIAGMFLPPEAVVARVELLPKLAGGPHGQYPTVYKSPATGPRFADLPLVVLVGPETVGGGELIAAALQENGRAVVCGQRTAGRAATQELISLGFDRLQFKATYGTSLRPSGRPRHRTPTSLPTDDWGIRPNPGLEVPLTPVVAAQLRAWAEDHALRRPGSRVALPFDDPDRDPVRATALAHLRKVVGPPGAAVQN